MEEVGVCFAEPVIVTRHPALVAVLRGRFPELEDAPVITHASIEDVRGRHVYGVLPLRLAAEAFLITEVTLNLPLELRGKELTEEQVRAYMVEPRTYKVANCPAPIRHRR